MSESSLPEPQPGSPPADFAAPAPPDADRVRSEIEAEIADHLASSAASLVRSGVDPAAAQALATRRFGGVKRVIWQCFWIRLGDQIMFRVAGITLCIAVVCGMLLLAYGGWQMQGAMDQQMTQLHEDLAALNQTQTQLLKQTTRQPLEIAGKAYYGDPSNPANGASIRIGRFKEVTTVRDSPVEIVRTVKADDQGVYHSGPLPPGDFCLMAALGDPSQQVASRMPLEIQSQPFYLYPDIAPTEPVLLDIGLKTGAVRWELSGSLPELVSKPAESAVDSPGARIAGIVFYRAIDQLDAKPLPSRPAVTEPETWPLRGSTGFRHRFAGVVSYDWYDTARSIVQEEVLPPGRYVVRVAVCAVAPSTSGIELLPDSLTAETVASMGQIAFRTLESGINTNRGIRGGRSGRSSSGDSTQDDPAAGITFKVTAGETTVVRIEVPTDFERLVREVVESPEWPILNRPSVEQLPAILRPQYLDVAVVPNVK